MSLNHQISCLFLENFLDEKVIAICGRCMMTAGASTQDKTDITRAADSYPCDATDVVRGIYNRLTACS